MKEGEGIYSGYFGYISCHDLQRDFKPPPRGPLKEFRVPLKGLGGREGLSKVSLRV